MLEDFKDKISGFDSAIDCGAGIGRITKQTLLQRFAHVDLLEPASSLIAEAQRQLPTVRRFYQEGLQEFEFETKYDCIWVQWCLMYLTDQDCLNFFRRA